MLRVKHPHLYYLLWIWVVTMVLLNMTITILEVIRKETWISLEMIFLGNLEPLSPREDCLWLSDK
jgi:hypothetical protein